METSMISAVGISVVDHIMKINGFKNGEGSFHCEEYIVEGGGMAATACCAASKLGSQTRLFTRIGDDVNGILIQKGLEACNVDFSGMIKVSGSQSTVSIVLVDETSGEKQFYSQWDKPAYIDPLPLDTGLLTGTEILLLDGHWTEGALEAAVWARTHNIPVVADFKRHYKGLEKLFPFIDYFIVPLFFGEELTEKRDFGDILLALRDIQNGIPVLTMGEQGGIYLKDEAVRRYPSFPTEPVDSTGAGDAFHGAFCHFISNGIDFDKCLILSSAVGALNCRSFGGRRALPDREELEKFLRYHGQHL